MKILKNRSLLNSIIAGLMISLLFSCAGNKEKSEKALADSLAMARPVDINEVMGIGEIQPSGEIVNLASQSSGIISSINVKIGETLGEGQLLLTLENALENDQIQQSNSKINTQKRGIDAAQANINVLNIQLDKAKQDLARDQSLFDGKAITLDVLNNAKYNVRNIEQQIMAQQSSVEQQKSRIPELQADINLTKTTINQKRVKAPAFGTLLSLNVKKGEYLSPSQSIGEFAPAGPTMALTEIDELFATKVKVGQKAKIRYQGSEEVVATGTVVLTSPYLRKKSLFSDNSANLEDRRVREVRVELDDASNILIGARVECWIEVK